MGKDYGYREFEIPKRSGGYRKIEAPNKPLKKKQRKLLKELEREKNMKPSYFVHSFMKSRSAVTAAKPHVGHKYLAKMDITDFFESIRYFQLKKVLKNGGYEGDKLEGIKKWCFRNGGEIKKIFADGEFQQDKSYLPQGAPTSPFLSNVFLRHFDWKIAWFGAKPVIEDLGFEPVYFTRYADDIFLSSNEKFWLEKVIDQVRSLLRNLNLSENKDKFGIYKDGQRKMVCGIVVNEKLNLPREKRKKIRAMKHNAQYDERGLDAERKGWLALQNMVNNQEEFPENSVDTIKYTYLIRNKI